MKCQAAWLLEPFDDLPLPAGTWHICGNEAAAPVIVRMTSEVVAILHLCPAHRELALELTTSGKDSK